MKQAADPPSGKRVVLIVDDDADHRRLVRLMLEGKYEVIEAENSNKALDVALSRNLDYVLTDSNLPDFDGMELCRLLRMEFLNTLAIIFVSATAEHPAAREQMIDAGCNAIVSKPFRHKDLLEVMYETHEGGVKPVIEANTTTARVFRSLQDGLKNRSKR